MIVPLARKEGMAKRLIDWIYTQSSEERKEVLEEMTVDYWNILSSEGKKEVLEGRLIHYYYNEGFEGRKGVLEGRSIGYSHIVTESTRQEEEEALSTPIQKESVSHPHIVEYVLKRFPFDDLFQGAISLKFLYTILIT